MWIHSDRWLDGMVKPWGRGGEAYLLQNYGNSLRTDTFTLITKNHTTALSWSKGKNVMSTLIRHFICQLMHMLLSKDQETLRSHGARIQNLASKKYSTGGKLLIKKIICYKHLKMSCVQNIQDILWKKKSCYWGDKFHIFKLL